ncbi:uncharacterized protein Z520_03195 [Fonsecaea multimorphosa CBS 102226]|uniref:Uncharacterized protein n=1 Tax=Fonsecaea multimorphosa CBS 102226 TaxID=1442371 RepID=A0A0D2IU52_9EURO|nr:uncharacterized protein Z520_03195 [Fonsecaea multimorphosa CBS 102226]KIY00532.1 hypothetical protein Z520_03195 [Fonsecaea multimorphosa CBS 102226]OAL18928.1 hypothetical protein AYO22_10257 [Fonsecaea multimorphosa]
MRLINVRTMQLEEVPNSTAPQYAILSHRWEQEEVTLQDMSSQETFGKRGFSKIQQACWLARNKELAYLWVDTCCIDKTSSAELTEAINSMYRWYQDAQICFAYLTDIEIHKRDMKDSVWFTRGWTLQELIAPKHVSFYDRNWVFLGTKDNLAGDLSNITGIDRDVLIGQRRHSSCSIAQRMSWASKRSTERIEDRAYSLLGIFDVSMPMLYGEGEKSFTRLQEEIIKHSDDQSIFAWDRGLDGKNFRGHSGLLASSPSHFATCQNVVTASHGLTNTRGFALTNVGLEISLLTVPWAMETYLCILNCSLKDWPQYRVGIFLERLYSSQNAEQYARVQIDGATVLTLPLRTILCDSHCRERTVHVRPNIIDAPMRRWHGFRLHDFTLPGYTMNEIHKARFHFCYSLQSMSRYTAEERRAAQDGLLSLPLRPIYFHMPRARGRPMSVRGTAAVIYVPPSRRDKNGERICWMKFGFDEDFRPVCIFGRRKSLWGGNAAHLTVDEDSYYDAEEEHEAHARLFLHDWLNPDWVNRNLCTTDSEIAASWQRRDFFILKGVKDWGLDRQVPFLRLRISIRLESLPFDFPSDGRPESPLPGMNVWTINVSCWRGSGDNGAERTAVRTGELVLRSLDDVIAAF